MERERKEGRKERKEEWREEWKNGGRDCFQGNWNILYS